MNVLQAFPPSWAAAPEIVARFDRYPQIAESDYETDLEIRRPEGVVQIRRKSALHPFEVRVRPHDAKMYIARASCESTFSLDLILAILERRHFAWLCDSLARHDDSNSIPRVLQRQLFSYVAREDFAGKRLLDFGCGDGASSLAMAQLLPNTEIVGVELDPERIDLAQAIQRHRGIENAQFLCSPSGNELPPGIGSFDFVMLSAVYEHLLPIERKKVMPLLWSAMRPGAMIFINQTPYRYSPFDAHSTGLWLVNYFPDRLAHLYVRTFAGRNQQINRSKDWNVHSRGGLRGGTEREILRNLTSHDKRSARIARPSHEGVHDRAALWLSGTHPTRFRLIKKLIASGFRLTDRLCGTIPALNLEVVIEKLA
jgi:predicted O-methyltransferase YrrM